MIPIASHCKSIVGTEFFKPVFGDLKLSRFRRNCPALTDSLWLESGIRRCLGLFQSGRDFLQGLSERQDPEILQITFFESLKSMRRLVLLNDILAQVQAHMRRAMPDPFAAFNCLDDFDLYAGAGHFIAAASHDKATPRKSPASTKSVSRTAAFTATKYATDHLYSLDLRSHGVTHLTVSDQVEHHKEHDMRALKRQDIYLTNLSPGVPPGIVALLYKARWDVEKVFDEFKKTWRNQVMGQQRQCENLPGPPAVPEFYARS